MRDFRGKSAISTGAVLLVLAAVATASAPATARIPAAVRVPAPGDPLYLVAAPDRGFLGNEEARDAVNRLREVYPDTELWIVTHEETGSHLRSALEALRRRGGEDRPVVVLPLFLTSRHALLDRARAATREVGRGAGGLKWSAPLGESYLAEEILFDRVEALSVSPAEERLVLVGAGAGSAADARRIREALLPMTRRATEKYGLGSPPVVEVLYDASAPDSLTEGQLGRVGERVRNLAAAGERPLVVPFGLAWRSTTMMSTWSRLGRPLGARGGDRIAYDGTPAVPHANVGFWLQRAATRHRVLDRDEIGVVFVPHGSDYGWNETMRAGLAPLRDEYTTVDAFSMVDPYVLRRAIRRLEDRGMKAALVVRIFSLESSFREKAEYVLGLRESYRSFPSRIRTPLHLHTLGGMERTPHLVDALEDRLASISEDPARETVILLGHGAGDEERNDHWMSNLEHLAGELKARTERRFRAYRHHTWREDWPEQREEAVAAIRAMVEEASREGGAALVVPVRTAARGPAPRHLQGLEYRYATGFAPHPAFTTWVRSEIERGVAELGGSGPAAATRR